MPSSYHKNSLRLPKCFISPINLSVRRLGAFLPGGACNADTADGKGLELQQFQNMPANAAPQQGPAQGILTQGDQGFGDVDTLAAGVLPLIPNLVDLVGTEFLQQVCLTSGPGSG